MSDSSTNRAIRRIPLAALVVAALCIPGRADPIGDPTGACCLPDGACVMVTGTQCGTQGGAYQGDGVTCDDADCPVFGACCIPFGICEVTTIQVCFGDLGGVIWAPEQDCVTFDCPPLGACCKPDGSCQVTAQTSCEITFGGTYQGDGTECEDVTCPRSCPGDFDGSGDVSVTDLLILLGAWGTSLGDVTGDGTTDVVDLLALLGAWGACG